MKQKKENNGKTEEDQPHRPARRTGPFDRGADQQPGSRTDAPVGFRNLSDFQRALCVFSGTAEIVSGNLDLYFPGASGRKPDDPAEKVCSPVSLQLRGGLCLQRNAGCT